MQQMSLPGKARGFSLFELMVVIVLLALVTGLILPNLTRGLSGLELDAAARDMVTLMKRARSEAIAEQRVFRVLLKNDPEQPADSYIYANEYEEEIKAFPFPRGVRILLEERDVRASHGIVSFYPNGRSSGANFQLRNEQGKTLLVEVDPVTGFARLHRTEEGQ